MQPGVVPGTYALLVRFDRATTFGLSTEAIGEIDLDPGL